MIDRVTIDKITDAARIEEVVGDFVTLKRAGVNLKGLCPFHDDRTPSFIVSPAKNYCKCFACGEGGNPVTFVMKHEQLSYPDALRYLAKKYGIPIQERELSEEEMQRKDDRESMFILNEWARDWFRRQLMETEDGRAIGLAYFRSRGFRDDILEKFQVGYCPNTRGVSIAADALKAGYQEQYITNTPNERDTRQSIGTGLAFKNDKGELRDRFFGRVMWPIFTISGKVAGFGGRVLDAATKGVNMKYQNSPESIVYSKRRELYGLFQAKQAISRSDLCYLVEGYTDVMAMHQSGVENVVASSGTALTEEQIRLIHRLTDNIVVIYDGDAAGIKASQRGIDMLLRQGMNVKLLLLPDGEDPDSFARKHNATEFQTYLKEHQVDFIKFKTDLLMEEAKGDPIATKRLVYNIVQSIAVIPDEITRSLYVQETAQAMNMQERLIADAVSKQIAKNREEWLKQKERDQRNAALSGLGANIAPPSQTGAEQTDAEEWVPPTTADEIGSGISPEQMPQEPDNAELISSINKRDEMRFYQKEMELIRAIVRYGEQKMGDENENENETLRYENEGGGPETVIEYIDMALRQDNLTLRNPLLSKVLEQAVAHIHDEGFVAERFFLNHPDQAINSLAFELGTDKEQLSKLHKKQDDDHEAVDELVLHLLTDYKLEIVKEQLKAVTRETQDPELMNDMDRYTEVMTRFMKLKEVEKKLSLIGGDRVIG